MKDLNTLPLGIKRALIGALLLSACFPPEGSTPGPPGGTDGPPPGAAATLPNELLRPLPFPQAAPTDAWTRTAPATLVNEHGEQVQVLTGHHTHLQVTRLFPDRALVKCDACRAPVEGWIQRALIMPRAYVGTAEEQASADHSLALFVARIRRSARLGQIPPGLDSLPEPLDDFTRLLDRGFQLERNRAVAPPWGDDAGYRGPSAVLLRETAGWQFQSLEL